MLAITLEPRILLEDTEPSWSSQLIREYDGVDAMLHTFRSMGVTHIELHSIFPGDDPQTVLFCAQRIWDAGLSLTVHGAVSKEVGTFTQMYASLLPLLEAAKGHQPHVMITLHAYVTGDDHDKTPAAKKTNQLLRLWETEASTLGFRLALEINRDKKNGDPSVTCAGVLSMLEGTDPTRTGICFDMGHYYSNILSQSLPEDTVPESRFLQRVFHTHIHALGSGGTHFPFAQDTQLPLRTYINCLKNVGYGGIYNLELGFDRFPDRCFEEALSDSVAVLKDNIN